MVAASRTAPLSTLAVALTVFSAASCDQTEPSATLGALKSGDSQGAVASVGETLITLEDLQEQINREQPFVRARYSTPEKAKQYLDNLVRFEVLAREAAKLGYGEDPDIIRIFKQQMVSRMMQKDFEPRFDPSRIPSDEVKAHWTKNRTRFDKPPRVRISHILLKTEAAALDVLKEAQKLDQADEEGWKQLVRTHTTDPSTRPIDGDLGYQTPDKKVRERAILLAAFSMKNPGEIRGPIPSQRGYHIVRLTERVPGSPLSFEAVERRVRGDLYKELRQEGLKTWVAGLRKQTKVEIYEDQLAGLEVDTSDAPPINTDPDFFRYVKEFAPGEQNTDAEKEVDEAMKAAMKRVLKSTAEPESATKP